MGKKAAKKAARKLQKEAIEAIRITAAQGQIGESLLAQLKMAGILEVEEGTKRGLEEGELPITNKDTSIGKPPPTDYEWIPAFNLSDSSENRDSGSCMTPPTSGSNVSDETMPEICHEDNSQVQEDIKSILVARCRTCERMVWFRSPSRSLVELAVPGTSGNDGVVITRCGRCGIEADGGGVISDSIEVCAQTWLGAEFVCVAKNLAGREMRVLGGRGRTTVIDLSSVVKGLLDDEEWGEILLDDYRSGKRGEELISKTIKGGLL